MFSNDWKGPSHEEFDFNEGFSTTTEVCQKIRSCWKLLFLHMFLHMFHKLLELFFVRKFWIQQSLASARLVAPSPSRWIRWRLRKWLPFAKRWFSEKWVDLAMAYVLFYQRVVEKWLEHHKDHIRCWEMYRCPKFPLVGWWFWRG